MSCCPPAPRLVDGDYADPDRVAQDTEILPGESVECYMKRAENPSGLKDDLTGYVPYKIKNTTIPVDADTKINVKLELTPGDPPSANPPRYNGEPSGTFTWTISGNPSWLKLKRSDGPTLADTFDIPPPPPASPPLPPPERLTVSIVGESPTPDTPIQVSILVKVTGTKHPDDGGGPFTDERTFNFAVVKATGNNSIQFVNPLPGGRVTSEYNPNRVHPKRGVVAPHKGVDMSTPGSATNDVVAAADGTVVFCGNEPGGAGNYVKIDHTTPSGEHLCQTVYMHLEKWYVSVGQKVAAGQKIGKEGNTGIGTAAHLHFECRIRKNGKDTWVDPLPLIRGTTQVFPATNPDNSGAGTPTPKTSNAVLTTSDAAAKSGGCAEFSPDYPKPRTDSTPEKPPEFVSPSGTVFDKAWFFVMKHEVGSWWMTEPQYSPGDAELDAGLFETKLQRKKVGFVQHPADPGGVTKFGVAQGPNPKINVKNIIYQNAREVGYNNYWLRFPNTYETTKPKLAVMLMDMSYLHGVGGAKSILRNANVGSLNDDDSCRALQQSQANFFRELIESKPSRKVFINGWMKRSNELLAYALSLTFP